VQPSSPDL
jgi:alpha-tubulin suppressor-like RCC1 family protein